MTFPITTELQAQLDALSPTQSAFIAGYLWSRSQGGEVASATDAALAPAVTDTPARKITVISASQTGNAHGVAKQLLASLQDENLDASLVSAGDYKARQLSKEDIVLLVTSTQGEGEPPEEGVPLHRFVCGKKAPKLDGVSFAVFGLGDTSYPDFCQAGKDFDSKFGELGATRLAERVDADLEYQGKADAWIEDITQTLSALATPSSAPKISADNTQSTENTDENTYSKENPYTAELLQVHSLVDVTSDKNTLHVEIDLGESGVHYIAGDALGVITQNADSVVAEVLELAHLSGDETVNTHDGETTIKDALTTRRDLNQLTPNFVNSYTDWHGADVEVDWDNTSLVAVLSDFPIKSLAAQALFDALKPLTPRLYSIASAPEEVGEEVHLCVGEVAFEHHGNRYYGSASGLLSHLEEGDDVRIFVEQNPRFRLPENGDTPIIMIGAGTGIAPYRGFMQQREANGDSGKNWLFFGNCHFRKDFLYQAEWLKYRDSGLLTNIDLAWSRDGDVKDYVQDKIRKNAEEMWQWLQNGAHIYVCGDAKRMAKDVETALLQVIHDQGGLDEDDAEDYLNTLREDNRYQRDVY